MQNSKDNLKNLILDFFFHPKLDPQQKQQQHFQQKQQTQQKLRLKINKFTELKVNDQIEKKETLFFQIFRNVYLNNEIFSNFKQIDQYDQLSSLSYLTEKYSNWDEIIKDKLKNNSPISLGVGKTYYCLEELTQEMINQFSKLEILRMSREISKKFSKESKENKATLQKLFTVLHEELKFFSLDFIISFLKIYDKNYMAIKILFRKYQPKLHEIKDFHRNNKYELEDELSFERLNEGWDIKTYNGFKIVKFIYKSYPIGPYDLRFEIKWTPLIDQGLNLIQFLNIVKFNNIFKNKQKILRNKIIKEYFNDFTNEELETKISYIIENYPKTKDSQIFRFFRLLSKVDQFVKIFNPFSDSQIYDFYGKDETLNLKLKNHYLRDKLLENMEDHFKNSNKRDICRCFSCGDVITCAYGLIKDAIIYDYEYLESLIQTDKYRDYLINFFMSDTFSNDVKLPLIKKDSKFILDFLFKYCENYFYHENFSGESYTWKYIQDLEMYQVYEDFIERKNYSVKLDFLKLYHPLLLEIYIKAITKPNLYSTYLTNNSEDEFNPKEYNDIFETLTYYSKTGRESIAISFLIQYSSQQIKFLYKPYEGPASSKNITNVEKCKVTTWFIENYNRSNIRFNDKYAVLKVNFPDDQKNTNRSLSMLIERSDLFEILFSRGKSDEIIHLVSIGCLDHRECGGNIYMVRNNFVEKLIDLIIENESEKNQNSKLQKDPRLILKSILLTAIAHGNIKLFSFILKLDQSNYIDLFNEKSQITKEEFELFLCHSKKMKNNLNEVQLNILKLFKYINKNNLNF